VEVAVEMRDHPALSAQTEGMVGYTNTNVGGPGDGHPSR